MNTKQRWSHFVNGVPGDFRKELEDLNEAQLQSLHKLFIRNRISGGASSVIGAFALVPSCGVSAIGLCIGSRRMAINAERIGMIEALLRRKGWKGHDKSWRDYALPVTMGVVGMAVGFGGIDAMASSGVDGGPAPTEMGAEPEVAPDEPPEMEDSFAPSTDEAGLDTPMPQDVPVPPPAEVPTIEWIMTEQGITPAIDGVPIDATYGEVILDASYQVPLETEFADPSGYPAWGEDPSMGGIEGYGPGIDPMYDELPVPPPEIDPVYDGLPVVPPGMDSNIPLDQIDLGMGVDDGVPPEPIGLESDYNGDGFPPGPEQASSFEQQLYETYFPMDASDAAYGAAGGAVAVAMTHVGTHVGASVAPQAFAHTHHHGVDEMLRDGAEKLVKEAAAKAAKQAVKSIWEALEKGHEVPKPGNGPGQIQLTPEFEVQFRRLLGSSEWKALQDYLSQNKERLEKGTTTSSAHLLTGLPPHQQDCLALLCLSGYDKKLNQPSLLRLFIELAEGNVTIVKAWIDEYKRDVPRK